MQALYILSLLSLLCSASGSSPWDPQYTAQATRACNAMNLSQKISLLHGHSILDFPYVGNIPATLLPSLGLTIPPFNLEDGPSGVADAVSFVTSFPNAGTVLQSWDRSLLYQFGKAMGAEQYLKGTNVALAPAVNLARVPWGGRVFEWLGEDTTLASIAAAAITTGIQANNISACVKHAFLNSQETNRNTVSENAPQNVLEELYFPPFRAAVDAGVGFAMCAYNRINGVYSCENNATLMDLKLSLGFRGPVISDWYATHSTIPSATSGLDMEMPGGFYFSDTLEAAVKSGAVPQSKIDDMVIRVLTPAFVLGLVDNPPTPARNVFANASSSAHNTLARVLAEGSIALLKNTNGTLPLPPTLKTWAVFGDEATVSGHGSGGVSLPYLITPTQGINALIGGGGGVATYYPPSTPLATAVAAAAAADVAIVVLATTSSEGADRPSLEDLPKDQLELAAALVAAQPRTIGILRCPGACTLPPPLLAALPSLLYEGMAGQESGASIAATLLGVNNPSGKLPITFPASTNATWLSAVPGGAPDPERWPGTERGRGFPESDYKEGLLMGWPYYESAEGAAAPPPLFPFGHGESYSQFVWGGPVMASGGHLSASLPNSSITLTFTLALAPGSPPGAEVVQVYCGATAPPPQPGDRPRNLVDFAKVPLTPGAPPYEVSFTLSASQLARYRDGAWVIPVGTFKVDFSSSSATTKLSANITVAA